MYVFGEATLLMNWDVSAETHLEHYSHNNPEIGPQFETQTNTEILINFQTHHVTPFPDFLGLILLLSPN